MRGIWGCLRAAASALIVLPMSGCGGGAPTLGAPSEIAGFVGAVAADEPQAARIGQHILLNNGTAADAAVAMGFALAVTLPSRAGLGGGGACLAYRPHHGAPTALLFPPRAPAARSGDRPAAVPMLALGLFALHEKFGDLPVEQDIVPAEELARLGVEVSAPLAADLAVVDGGLLADPAAAAVFSNQGVPLAEGDLLIQHDLGAALARLRIGGARDLYDGQLARTLVTGSAAAGGAISAADLAGAGALLAAPLVLGGKVNSVAFLPPPEAGGVAAEVALTTVAAHGGGLSGALGRSLGAALALRQGVPAARIMAGDGGSAPSAGVLPATTSFVALDRAGDAVACALTMDNLFGTGRVAPGTGMVLAASPAVTPAPLLSAAIAWSKSADGFRAEIAGSGLDAAALGVGYGMYRALHATVAMPSTVPGPGRINAIACARYLPGDPASCSWSTDPRGGGLALGGE